MKAQVPFGDNAMLFILAGVFGFRMTRGISRKTEKAISNNQPMLTYPLVRPLDTLIATFLLESTIWLIICALFMSGLAISLDRDVIVYPGEFAEAMFADVRRLLHARGNAAWIPGRAVVEPILALR